jgi:hypothetical protein
VGRRRTRIVRLALAVASAAALAAVAATVAHALAFDDAEPCRDTQPVFVCPEGAVGKPYSIQLVGRGGCGPSLPYQYRVLNGALPPGLSLSGSGSLSGTPTQSGEYRFWLELSDENPPSQSWCDPKTAEREFSIDVLPGLRITTNSVPPNASIGVPYSAALETLLVTSLNPLAGTTPTSLTWTVQSFGTGLPPGLALGNGVITGTPTAEGSYTFRVEASIDPTRTHSQTYSLTVRQPLSIQASRPLATLPAPTLWEVGVPFSARLTPSGGSGTYTYTLAEGALPTGMALAADGTVTGTPKTAGSFRATARLADSEGRTLDYAVNFGIAEKLSVSTLLLRPGKVGKLYKAKLKTAGGISPKTWKVVSGPLPRGITLDRTLGVLAGTPTKPGSYRVTFEAKDALKVVARKTLRIVVAP